LQVSHWGRVYIEERYTLRNVGTAVVPPFSRWDFTAEAMSARVPESPHVRLLPLSLPKAAQYIYTKDDLGHTQARCRR
jgi:Ribophorin I